MGNRSGLRNVSLACRAKSWTRLTSTSLSWPDKFKARRDFVSKASSRHRDHTLQPFRVGGYFLSNIRIWINV